KECRGRISRTPNLWRSTTMSENLTNSAASETSNEAREVPAHRAMFDTLAEAEAAKPAGTKLKVFAVTHAIVTRWTCAATAKMAMANAAKADGYTAQLAGKPVSKENLAAGLAALSPEDRAALIAQYVPAPEPKVKGKK